MTSTPEQAPRPLRPALAHGLRGKCPNCGVGELFKGFLNTAPACRACGQAFDGHEAHDFPAYIVILLLGHILIPTMITVNAELDIPVLWQSIIWPVVTVILALVMLRPVKGAVIAYQWARRMHGFAR